MGRRGEHSKEEIAQMALDAAIALLEEEGPDRLTTRAVAQRIGYTAGSLYFVFRNRDDLVLRVNERTLDELRADLEQAFADTEAPAARLHALGRCYLQFAERHPTRWRLVFEHDVADPDQVPEAMRRKIDAFFRLIAAELSRRFPGLRADPIRRAAQSLWGGVHGIALLSITGKLSAGGERPAAALVEDLIATYLLGLEHAD
jgi:AcrR family transcriptional regulator